MVNYKLYKYKCRCCFQFIGPNQKCFNYNETHREIVQEIVGFETPVMLHEDYAKICSVCEAVISDFFKVKKRMIELQRGFINFLDEHQHQQNPSDHIIPEVFTSPHPPDVKKTSTTVIIERKLSKNIQRTRLEKPANQNHKLPELDKQANYCAICEKSFSHRFTAISHMKMVHLKIKDHQCDLCSYASGSKSNLIRHIERNHIAAFSAKVSCPDCGLLVAKKYLMIHRKTRHMQKVMLEAQLKNAFVCCQKIFFNLSGVMRHCRQMHGGENIYKIVETKNLKFKN